MRLSGWSSALAWRSWSRRGASGMPGAFGPLWWSLSTWVPRGQPSPPRGFPLSGVSLAPTSPCARCTDRRGGVQFPWIGVWNRRCLLVQEGLGPSVIMRGRRASTFWHFSGWHRTSARWTSCPSTWVWPWSGWTRVRWHLRGRVLPSGPDLAARAEAMAGTMVLFAKDIWPHPRRRPTWSSFPHCASSAASVESVDRSCARAAIHGNVRCVSTVLAQTSAIVLAGLMADHGRYATETAGSSRWGSRDTHGGSDSCTGARVSRTVPSPGRCGLRIRFPLG